MEGELGALECLCLEQRAVLGPRFITNLLIFILTVSQATKELSETL